MSFPDFTTRLSPEFRGPVSDPSPVTRFPSTQDGREDLRPPLSGSGTFYIVYRPTAYSRTYTPCPGLFDH